MERVRFKCVRECSKTLSYPGRVWVVVDSEGSSSNGQTVRVFAGLLIRIPVLVLLGLGLGLGM